MTKQIHIFIILFLASFTAMSQSRTNETYSFLELTNSSRILGLGGNFVSINDNDVSLSLSNPSFINDSIHMNAAINYTNYFGGINYEFATYSHSFKNIGSFAASLQYLNYGNFTETDEMGNIKGNFKSYEMATIIGWGREIHPGFTIGANAKFIYSDFNIANSVGLAVDVAGSYYNREKNFSTTLLFRNIGRQIKPYYQGNIEPLPFDIQIALSKKLEHVPLRFSLMAHHLYKWNIRHEDPNDIEIDALTNEIIEEKKLAAFGDKLMRHFVIGAELTPFKFFSLRLGYNYHRRKELAVSTRLKTVGFSWGFGIKIRGLNLSYSRSAYSLAGSPNVVTISSNIGNFIKK